MKVAVTGATGFIGQALCRELAAAGHRVLALTRHPDSAHGRFPNGVEVVGWDASGSVSLPSCDAVAHFAGESVGGRWTAAKKEKIRESRARGTRALVDSIQTMEKKPSVLVSASGIGYYGDRGDETLTEADPPGDDFLAHVCMEWEAEARRAETLGLRTVQLRWGIVLDRDGGALPLMALPFKFGVGGHLGSGRQWISWIHRDDVMGLLLHALERPDLSGPVNGCVPNPVTNREFSKTLGRAMHRPALLPVPGFALKLVMGEFAETVLGGQRAVPTKALAAGFSFRYSTLPEALAEIY